MSTTSDREIVITRTINAPRERVWQAWSTKEHLEQWYGPDGFRITTHEFSFTVGGLWRFTMHGPDGHDWPNHILYTAIEEPLRIENDHGADDGNVLFQAAITFEEDGTNTLLTMRSVFASAEERDRVVREVGAIEGGKQTLGRLAEFVDTMK
jgi:uncharacterized protein YndB with AHSA1/START domain